MKSVWIQESKWNEIDDYLKENDTVILPVGSTEQHALCLPLGTDAYMAIRLAEDAGIKAKVLVAPPLWYGWTIHHLAWPGSITISPDTLTKIVEEISNSLIYHGFNKIVIINGHRVANLAPLEIAAVKVTHATGAFTAVVDPIYLGDKLSRSIIGEGLVGHADELETSHMIYLYPHLTDMSKATNNSKPDRPYFSMDPYKPSDRVFSPPTIEKFKERTLPNGATANSTLASEEKGKMLHEGLVANFVEFLEIVKGMTVKVHTRKHPN